MKGIINSTQLKYLFSLRNNVSDLILEMEKFANEHNVPILNWKASELLQLIIAIKKPKRVLEIGMAISYSSILIAQALRKKGILHTIEKSKNNIIIARENIRKANLDEKIKIHEGDALEIMPQMEKKFDLIFLDADKQDYEKLFYLSIDLLKKGGILFVDNLLWHGYVAAKKVPSNEVKSTKLIRNFNKIFLESDKLNATIYPIGDGIGIGIKL